MESAFLTDSQMEKRLEDTRRGYIVFRGSTPSNGESTEKESGKSNGHWDIVVSSSMGSLEFAKRSRCVSPRSSRLCISFSVV